jgi:cell division protein FtsL
MKLRNIILVSGICIVIILACILVALKTRSNNAKYAQLKSELEVLINESDSLNTLYNDLELQLKELEQTTIKY